MAAAPWLFSHRQNAGRQGWGHRIEGSPSFLNSFGSAPLPSSLFPFACHAFVFAGISLFVDSDASHSFFFFFCPSRNIQKHSFSSLPTACWALFYSASWLGCSPPPPFILPQQRLNSNDRLVPWTLRPREISSSDRLSSKAIQIPTFGTHYQRRKRETETASFLFSVSTGPFLIP